MATNETFSLNPQQQRQLQTSFRNIMKQDVQQSVHGAVGLFLAVISLYGALQKKNDNVQDMVSLVSSVLGTAKATVGLIDTGRKGFVASSEVKELRLFSEAAWCKKIGTASNILGFVSAGFELINTLKALHDGEPGRVVTWMFVNVGLTVATTVIGCLVIGTGAGVIIGIVGMVFGVLFTDLAAQELTLAQRLWIHRGIFGRHNTHYHDSVPFGGETNAGALVHFDRATNALHVKNPFGGSEPLRADEAAYKAYQLKALNEEKGALGMLVRGITLEVDVNTVTPFAAPIYLPESSIVYAAITLSIPEKVDGIIKLELSNVSKREFGGDNAKKTKGSLNLTYRKIGLECPLIENRWGDDKKHDFQQKDGMFVLELFPTIEKDQYDLSFTLSTIDEKYIPVASDHVVLKTKVSFMWCKKIALCLIFFIFSSVVKAEVLYIDQEQGNMDFTFIPFQELQAKENNGDHKSQYLLALHKTRDPQQKKEGVRMLEELAAANVVDAKHALYEISDWVKVDSLTPQKALNYLKEAAEDGYDISQIELARCYYSGDFGKSDPEKTHYWFMRAALQGNTRAFIYVVNDYFLGRGVAKDNKKAFEWLMKNYNASGRKFDDWRMLAQAYENGIGTPVDLAKAYMCFDMLGTAGIEEKERIAPRMTEAQKAEGLRLSEEWQEKNHVYTMQSLGLKHQQDGSYQ